jgi:hypothetical protein
MEEVLILFLWVHTRSCQQAFGTRSDPESLRLTLDSLHRAVYEDMEAHGISRDTLPLFEQRLSARYQAYYAAANGEPVTVVELAASHITGGDDVSPAVCAALAESTMTAAGPLRDLGGPHPSSRVDTHLRATLVAPLTQRERFESHNQHRRLLSPARSATPHTQSHTLLI